MKPVKFLLVIGALAVLGTEPSKGQQLTTPFQSIEVLPTIAYLNIQHKPRRMVRLFFKQGLSYAPGKIEIRFNGYLDSMIVSANINGLGQIDIPLPGPLISNPRQALISLKASGQTYTARCIVNPAKMWSVYVLPHSHVDIGFTLTQDKVLKLHMRNIDDAIRLGEKTRNYPASARFRWNTEAIWVVDNYLRLADAAKRARFWDAVRRGWINIDGAYGNTNTSATDSHLLTLLFFEGSKLARRGGTEIESMFQGDVPGASWGLASQAAQTGIKYFLSGPNAEDRIGNAPSWQDRPFYWKSPSGTQQILFWQCQPYSIGYKLKGSKIPGLLTQDLPKQFYSGDPSKNFLDPSLFDYLSELESRNFGYNMTILTWALNDNAPIDPDLPDAVRMWNDRYASPHLIITSTRDFFKDFEARYGKQIPSFSGDYTEYWTDGIATAARETALSRSLTDKLKQVDALWAIKGRPGYPSLSVLRAWKQLLLFNEHTWGAHNSISQPDDEQVKIQWAIKKGYVDNAQSIIDSLQRIVLYASPIRPGPNTVDVYNTLSWNRTDLVYVPDSLSRAGNLVKDAAGKTLPSQRLSSGELCFLAQDVPGLGKSTYSINAGVASPPGVSNRFTNTGPHITGNTIDNGIYSVEVDPANGDINKLIRNINGRNYVAPGGGLNQYVYLPGDSLANLSTTSLVHIKVKEKGPLVYSLEVRSAAPGCRSLAREIRMVNGLDKVELINTVDKIAIRRKESVQFSFPFQVPGAQVRYSVPWGSVTAESDQLPGANRNWYTIQRWVDVSGGGYGVTWSSPDAPLVEFGKISTAGLIGGLHHSALWETFTPQSSHIYSWVMNNLWHTNFRAEQEGVVRFRYFLHPHEAGYDCFQANKSGLNDHCPLLVTAASQAAGPVGLFSLNGKDIYLEELKPADDGNGLIVQLVNSSNVASTVTLVSRKPAKLEVWRSDLLEDRLVPLGTSFRIDKKGILMLRIESHPSGTKLAGHLKS